MSGFLVNALLSLPMAMLAISVHECAHAYVAYRLGDPTPKFYGRITLNPLAHLDPIGTLMLVLFKIGWAKPVPVNYDNFRRPARDLTIVALAGPASNLALALIWVLAIRLDLTDSWALNRMMLYGIVLNLSLAFFNLLPIPPLDGSKLLYLFLPYRYAGFYYWLERYGMFVIMFLAVTGILGALINPAIAYALKVLL